MRPTSKTATGPNWCWRKLRGPFPRLKLIWADGGYAGQLIEWTRQLGRWVLEIVKRSDDVSGFVVLPKRWIVETNLRLVRPLPASEQGLRNAHPKQRIHDLPGNDSFDGPPPQAVPCVDVFIHVLRRGPEDLRRTTVPPTASSRTPARMIAMRRIFIARSRRPRAAPLPEYVTTPPGPPQTSTGAKPEGGRRREPSGAPAGGRQPLGTLLALRLL